MSPHPIGGVISVIDDDPQVRSAIGNLLRASGYAVSLYESTASYSSAAGDTASCLLLDIRLSGESGLDFQAQLAERGDMTPVVLITGHGDIPMTVRAMRAGAIDFLPKPFEEAQLLQAVASALDADRRRLEAAAGNAELESRYGQLTAREKEVMALVVTGLMNKQVAARLELSEITVKIHRGNVMRKMAAQSLADLVRMAEQLGVRDATIHRYNI